MRVEIRGLPLRRGCLASTQIAHPDNGAEPVKGGKPVEVPTLDVEGYLVDPSEWSEAWARAAANAMNITLTDEHWEAIRFMRKYHEEHHVAPDARFVMRHLAETRGASRNRLFELFPFGYPGQACKIAGMRRPRAWSTG
jgi:TusE/DsrC/DsvC family sulfur relay protein